MLRWTWPRATFAFFLLYAALVLPVIIAQRGGVSNEADQRMFHEPMIRSLATHWPWLEANDYHTASTPGYHLLMAPVVKWVDDRTVTLQIFNSLLSAALLICILWPASRLAGLGAFALTLPFLCSRYFLGAAIWLGATNFSYCFVCLALAGLLFPPLSAARIGCSSLWVTLAVLVRQIHLWAIAPVWLAAWDTFGPAKARDGDSRRRHPERPEPRRMQLLLAMPLLVAPLLLVAGLIWQWGGLVPPRFKEINGATFRAATPAYVLALFGLLGAPYLTVAVDRETLRLARGRAIIGLLAIAACLAIVPATEFDIQAGRWGGAVWGAVKLAPTIYHRSILLPPLACLGAATLWLLWRRICQVGQQRSGKYLMVALAAWVTAQCTTRDIWQHYTEPLVLIFLIFLTALGWPRGSADANSDRASDIPANAGSPARWWWWTGPVLLTALQLVGDVFGMYLPALHKPMMPLHSATHLPW